MPLPDPSDILDAIAAAAGTALADLSEAASQAAEAFADATGSTAAEWEEFLEGLSAGQRDVLARLAALMVAVEHHRTAIGSVDAGTPERLREALAAIAAGAVLLREFEDAFPGAAVAQEVAATSPLLARHIGWT